MALLEDDARAPAPHLCLGFAASSFVYTAVARIALVLRDEGLAREAVALFALLVDGGDEEGLLATERFADTLMGLVDAILLPGSYESDDDGEEEEEDSRARPLIAGLDLQSEALEMIFGIAAKIRLEPELLPVWFRKAKPRREQKKRARRREAPQQNGQEGDTAPEDEYPQEEEQEKTQDTPPPEQEDEFPLCHQFVAHVYRDGRPGDFARTGLLYVFESAANSELLEGWVARSDLPTLMASGLGALYSELSRKLTIARPAQGLPLLLALSDTRQLQASREAESFLSEDLQARLATFMSYMVFWQDVLEHCHSSPIRRTLLDRFKMEFLQQILYPSLLESSDVDGGSSVAVLTYLCRILDSVTHPDLNHLILHYLLALPEAGDASSSHNLAHPSAIKTLTNDNPLNPSYFNLTDLLLASCKSPHPETVTAALRLVTSILDKHHSYAVDSLVRTVHLNPEPSTARSVGALSRDVEQLIGLARDVGGPEGMDAMYDASLRDNLVLIEAHPCAKEMLGFDGNSPPRTKQTFGEEDTPTICTHSISPHDPLMKQLNILLQTFLTNDVETNLALTSTISQLALCPHVRLEGWLVRSIALPMIESDGVAATDETGYAQVQNLDEDDESDAAEEKRLLAYKQARRLPTDDDAAAALEGNALPMLVTLEYLRDTLATIRADIPEFATLVAGRKRAFQGMTELENEAMAATVLPPTTPIPLSPRRSLDVSRDASAVRAAAVIASAGAPSATMKRQQHQQPLATPDAKGGGGLLGISFQRGRALTMFTGSGGGRRGHQPSKSTSTSPDGKQAPSPASGGRPTLGTSKSSLPPTPSLDPGGGRRARIASRSPAKSPLGDAAAGRALSPLSAQLEFDDGLFAGLAAGDFDGDDTDPTTMLNAPENGAGRRPRLQKRGPDGASKQISSTKRSYKTGGGGEELFERAVRIPPFAAPPLGASVVLFEQDDADSAVVGKDEDDDERVATEEDGIGEAEEDAAARGSPPRPAQETGSGPQDDGREDDDDDGEREGGGRAATVTHLLTNAVVLQEWLLELAAAVHVRAGLLPGEARFA